MCLPRWADQQSANPAGTVGLMSWRDCSNAQGWILIGKIKAEGQLSTTPAGDLEGAD